MPYRLTIILTVWKLDESGPNAPFVPLVTRELSKNFSTLQEATDVFTSINLDPADLIPDLTQD